MFKRFVLLVLVVIFGGVFQFGTPDALEAQQATPQPTSQATGQATVQATQQGTEAGTPIYKDATRSVTDRVNDLMSRMTLDEKIGQMTLVEKGSIRESDIASMGIGGLLSGGGGSPQTNTAQAWADMVNGFQKDALTSRLGIPIIYGVDAIHGHNNLQGTVIFPHEVGLGAANDPDLVQRIGKATADVMIATGIYWDYAPIVAVPQDIRWGRTDESYSENPQLVSKLATAMIQGLQGNKLGAPGSVLATPKHYVADGGTDWGSSTSQNGQVQYKIDQGNASITEAQLRAIHLPPYEAAIKAGAMSIMVSYSSWNGLKMSANKYLITDVLKGELGFKGFTVSDWGAIDQISPDYETDVKTGINAGLDMIMVPTKYSAFIAYLKMLVNSGDVSQARIDDAVRRILTVKFEMGLFEHPMSDPARLADVGAAAQRALGREAVSKSLVLLQNNNGALPLSKNVSSIIVAGKGANDIGIQSGGWTITWQGAVGNITPGTTILQGIQATVSSKTKVTFDETSQATDKADVGIVVVGETPYAEGMGDKTDLALSASDFALVSRMRQRVSKLIVLLISGRPMIIGPALNQSDAFVAAWLPGTEGEGVADVLFGDKPFTGKLAYTWPRSMNQLPFDFTTIGQFQGCLAPLFPFGYGLSTADKQTVTDTCPFVAVATMPPVGPAATPTPYTGPVTNTDVVVKSTKTPLAPPEIKGKVVYIPFPVTITLDGKLDDWAGVPLTKVDNGPSPSTDPAEDGSVTFGVAADDSNLYVLELVPDKVIVTHQHGANYWNEDSGEFYVNQSGNLNASSYTDSIYQVNINPGDIGKTDPTALTLTGVNADKSKAKGIVFKTPDGWGFEASVPLLKKPQHGDVIGFQVHLNGSSGGDRNVKLIWSLADTGDKSYINPSLFGKGVFFQVGRTDVPTVTP